MNFTLTTLFVVGVLYLLVLFFIAYAAEREIIPIRIISHPVTYTLSLGVFATSWSFYGSVGFAQSQGYNFLTIYLGVTLAFLLGPILLKPILRLTRELQLSSLADVFAYRYHSQLAGVLVTIFMLVGTLPYIALQIRAVSESAQVLTRQNTPEPLALGFCITLILFAVLFGARHISSREKHEGLVLAIAFESLIKLTALIAVGLFSVFGIFGGFNGLDSWIQEHPAALQALYKPVHEGPWTTLLLLAFAAAFLLPRQFHMTFTENMSPRAVSTAVWLFPLFLLLLNLFIPVILWAGNESTVNTSADYYVLGLPLEHGPAWLTLLVFVGGVSAASAMMIVTTLALAAMSMNHLLLPASLPQRFDSGTNIYRWLLWGRRVLIAIIIFAGYGFYLLLEHNQGLVQLGLISFVAVAQFLPGIVGLLYWRRATRAGFISGLLAGGIMWAITLLVPLLERSGILVNGIDLAAILANASHDKWEFATFWSLSVNACLFIGVSLLTRQSSAEKKAANTCCMESISPPLGIVLADSTEQFTEQLARVMGHEMAELEVKQALQDLGMSPRENRPTELRQLRDRIERNLSGLIGPLLANMIVDERLQLDSGTQIALADSMRFLEQRLEASRSELKGLAGELDSLRRYHQQVLHDLPLGVCSISPDKVILSWNIAMCIISGLDKNQVTGKKLDELEEPWCGLLNSFLRTSDRHLHKVQTIVHGRQRWFNLHKASIESPDQTNLSQGTVLLLEDLTELQTLEAELAHSERLASIGRLAAGVAHEIGNPVTNIACLAQDLHYAEKTDELDSGLKKIVAQTNRISDIVQSLVRFSHSGTVDEYLPEPVNIHDCIDEAAQLVRIGRDAKQISFVNQCNESLSIAGDRQRLLQVFVNLFTNACDVSESGDRIQISSEVQNEKLLLHVTDEGKGISQEYLDRIFEPFFTTKPAGKGTGLGLAMVYNIIQQHGGMISVRSTLNIGTCFSITLPLLAQSTEQSRAARQ